eukprot:Platyproteum_vivax@DN7694_c11_g2_i1.p1
MSPTTQKYNILRTDGPQSEARLLKSGHWKDPSYEVYGSCTDRVGDPLPQGCYYEGESECPSGLTLAPSESNTWCRGDFTCVRQMGAWYLSGDKINGDRKQPAEPTKCHSSADCCGSWSRDNMVYQNSNFRSNVPIVCVPYSYVSSHNARLKETVKPKNHKSEKDRGASG